MQWFTDLISSFKSSQYDVASIKNKLHSKTQAETITDPELEAYIYDIDSRVKKMVKELKNIYSKYDIQFSGFKSLNLCCTSLRESLRNSKEEAYNNLLKLESSITAEQKRHVGLIKLSVSRNGKKVIDLINQNPSDRAQFNKVFGEHDIVSAKSVDGDYQKLWSEIHKLSEYIISQKNKIYH